VPVLEAMLNAGMVAARIDLSWGGLDFHRESLRALNVSHSRGCAAGQLQHSSVCGVHARPPFSRIDGRLSTPALGSNALRSPRSPPTCACRRRWPTPRS
jgi:hypothetical protein